MHYTILYYPRELQSQAEAIKAEASTDSFEIHQYDEIRIRPDYSHTGKEFAWLNNTYTCYMLTKNGKVLLNGQPTARLEALVGELKSKLKYIQDEFKSIDNTNGPFLSEIMDKFYALLNEMNSRFHNHHRAAQVSYMCWKASQETFKNTAKLLHLLDECGKSTTEQLEAEYNNNLLSLVVVEYYRDQIKQVYEKY